MKEPSYPVATVASFRRLGLTSLNVMCDTPNCGGEAEIQFDGLKLPDDMVFTDIPRHRRLICSRCGMRAARVMPSWRDYVAYRNGKEPV